MRLPNTSPTRTLQMTAIARKRRPPKTYSRRPLHSPEHHWLLLHETDTPPPPPRSPPTPPTDTPDTHACSSSSSSSLPKKNPTFTFTRTTTRRPAKATTTKPKPPQKLTQSIIDLGQSLRTTCKTCGMSYHPSTPDDESLHKRFHSKSVGGVDLTPCSKYKVVQKGGGEEYGEEKVLLVDRKSSVAEKRKVREVMKVVDVDLGAGEITDAVLWEEGVLGDRFKVYLYVQGKKCIGLLLAERITRAFCVLGSTPPKPEREAVDITETKPSSLSTASSSISTSSTPQKAVLGISRVWTCSSHRRQGVARNLLECARSTFIYGMTVEKEHVAFSQPTESGGGLARGWFGGEEWKVYVEQV